MVEVFTIPIEVGGLDRERFVQVEALVDMGASHTLLPRPLLEELGIRPIHLVVFRLADDRTAEYAVGQAALRLGETEMIVAVVFGEADATPLLGTTTLEVFNLGVDPMGQRLVPVPGIFL